jgi:hypothetical protein
MLEDIIIDIINSRICRPKIIFLKTKRNYFKSMKLFNFEMDIYFPDYISPNDLIILFILYYILEIIKEIILIINLNSC